MIWQDWLMLVAQTFFIYSLAVTIISSREKPPLKLCLLTAFGLLLIAIGVFSLGAWVSGIATFVTCVQWLVLAYQRYVNRYILS